MRDIDTGPRAASSAACPICGKPALQAHRPFCSRRCADVDLGRWFNESYRIPVRTPEQDDDEGSRQSGPASPALDSGDREPL